MKKYTIAIVGSTKRTVLCAQELKKSDKFEITWLLTPIPKPVGRKKVITPNELDIFGHENEIDTYYVQKKVDEILKVELENKKVDFLLVVDFGYIIPKWLLDLPTIAPLNIHPSQLPKWRGSSPGQYSILFNDKNSAVTLMKINDKFDQGPIVHQDFFELDPNWNHQDYYSHAFKLICENLDEKIIKSIDYSQNQPEESPTPTAKILKKEQTFVDWELLKKATGVGNKIEVEKIIPISPLLKTALEHNKSLALTLERASKAFYPWPNLWTIINTQKGAKRMKLLDLKVEVDASGKTKLIIEKVQIEGKNPTSWNEIKNLIIE
ncbi:hypothetical protein KA111_01655 [Candidatus Woesebacteria bacterium]|nr:hypothetical protein [Candidatus Woesebacteria bacterium]